MRQQKRDHFSKALFYFKYSILAEIPVLKTKMDLTNANVNLCSKMHTDFKLSNL